MLDFALMLTCFRLTNDRVKFFDLEQLSPFCFGYIDSSISFLSSFIQYMRHNKNYTGCYSLKNDNTKLICLTR